MSNDVTLITWARAMDAERRFIQAKRRILDNPETQALIARIEKIDIPGFRMPTLDEQVDDTLRKAGL